MKRALLGATKDELKNIALECGLPAFAGGQMAAWLYQKRVRSIDGMTDLSKAGRERLKEQYELGLIEPLESLTSRDGTRKYLFPFRREGVATGLSAIEAVVIPDGDRKTLCVSSQAGCKMGCRFCMTGRQGFHGNLSAAEILSQFLAIEEAPELTNTVFMGMGEPLDNWDEVRRAISRFRALNSAARCAKRRPPSRRLWPNASLATALKNARSQADTSISRSQIRITKLSRRR